LLLEQKVQELSEKVAALEGFVKALQEEGYLTLAKIKQAAADNCPICNHTHEDNEQPEEPTPEVPTPEQPRPEYPTPEQPTV
jgi:hypothetical protein